MSERGPEGESAVERFEGETDPSARPSAEEALDEAIDEMGRDGDGTGLTPDDGGEPGDAGGVGG